MAVIGNMIYISQVPEMAVIDGVTPSPVAGGSWSSIAMKRNSTSVGTAPTMQTMGSLIVMLQGYAGVPNENTGAYVSGTAIDFTRHRRLVLDFNIVTVGNSPSSSRRAYVTLLGDKSKMTASRRQYDCELTNNIYNSVGYQAGTSLNNLTMELDISNATGNYYIGIGLNTDNSDIGVVISINSLILK